MTRTYVIPKRAWLLGTLVLGLVAPAPGHAATAGIEPGAAEVSVAMGVVANASGDIAYATVLAIRTAGGAATLRVRICRGFRDCVDYAHPLADAEFQFDRGGAMEATVGTMIPLLGVVSLHFWAFGNRAKDQYCVNEYNEAAIVFRGLDATSARAGVDYGDRIGPWVGVAGGCGFNAFDGAVAWLGP